MSDGEMSGTQRRKLAIDLLYSDPSLVGLYDALNDGDHDFSFYQRLIGRRPVRVLDLGCGTGRFAVNLAADGHDVVGVDPASRMLEVARSRPGGRSVRWIEGDATALPLGVEMDVVVMTGHAFQCLLTDDAVSSTLAAVRRVLPEGGRFMFESRNPLDRAWERWMDEPTPPSTAGDAGHTASVRHTVVSVDDELVTFVTDYDLPDRVVQSRSTLRFLSRERIDVFLREQGFLATTYYGDWSGAPWTASSPEIIAVAA